VVGVALLSAAWIELSATRELQLFEDFERVRDGARFWPHAGEEELPFDRQCLAAGAVSLLALAASLLRLRRVAVGVSLLAAAGIVVLLGRAVSLAPDGDLVFGGCTGRPAIATPIIHGPAELLIVGTAVACAWAWWRLHESASRQVGWVALSVLAVIAAGAMGGLLRANSWTRPIGVDQPHVGSSWPALGLVAAAGAMAIVLVWRVPVLVSRAVSLASLGLGVLGAAGALALSHDLSSTQHERHAWFVGDEVETRRCEALVLAPVVRVEPGQFVASGSTFASPSELRTFLAEQEQKLVDLQMQAGDLAMAPREYVVDVRHDTPLSQVVELARIINQNGWANTVAVASLRVTGERMWFWPARHTHECVVRAVLSRDAGLPISSFNDWPALVRAVDDSPTPLVLRVE